ncbi:MAG: helicase-related protein [Thermomicrobiales bacterium]
MARLEELTRGATVAGILPAGPVTVVDVKWHGTTVVELTYKDAAGNLGHELLFRDNETALEIVEAGAPWSFDGDAELLRLVSEAKRISLAYLFDPLLAVHTSQVDPLPHQIVAVYEEMLTRQPLRFLLADDPGAGKTIMAGLLIKELFARGDLQRCLIVCPGSLVDQWQDELWSRFHLPFDIVTSSTIEESRSGNPFLERKLVIARLDHLARNDEVQAKLTQTEWDLIVCDEAHKMSAHFLGGEVERTKRYKLGELLGGLCRHFLLMTATPHNGKEEDFQLFLRLLDADRFEGKFRDGVHQVDASDLMRRLVKEQLLKFDGTPLFPERIATTLTYPLSEGEAALYKAVTDYVREQMLRADAIGQEGDNRRKAVVGFALTILQRRLASSPWAIAESLRRRRERLEKRLREEQLLKRGAEAALTLAPELTSIDADDIDEMDEDAPAGEVEEIEERVVDQASAARTINELRGEIAILRNLEALALEVRESGKDRKWDELSRLLQGEAELFKKSGRRHKLIIFTEHKDTLNYLKGRIAALLGRPEAIRTIDGSLGREERRKVQGEFTHDEDVQILIATDAAGEGVNLQRAHLMVNYDLPWNPNRLEQRFGRIHRIGQTEVCHLWNLVAQETREGDVFKRLFEKLEIERAALGGQVFDVLGRVFGERPLRDVLIAAIRYGERDDVRARLFQQVDEAMDHQHLIALIEERALVRDSIDTTRVMHIREAMERAQARRLQPHFIEAFFLDAFQRLGGTIRVREPRRYEITNVPALIRARDRQIGAGEPVQKKYERVVFEKALIHPQGKPGPAAFLCPGHPLLDAVIDLILERHRDLLRRGAALVAPADLSLTPRALVYLEHTVQDGKIQADGSRRVISRRLQFVEIDAEGTVRDAGPAPYLDYRPLEAWEREETEHLLTGDWIRGIPGAEHGLEELATSYASQHLAPDHLREIKARKEEMVERTMAAVQDRLQKEINYWDLRANQLKQQEEAGKSRGKRLNAEKARQRADELADRLQTRLAALQQERKVSAAPAVVVGGALVIPYGLVRALSKGIAIDQEQIARVDRLAVAAVLAAERLLGHEPRELAHNHPGYDVESRDAAGRLRFIEIKGKSGEQETVTVTVTKTQILTALNAPDQFILALVMVDPDQGRAAAPRYVRQPFGREPDFGVTSVNYEMKELLARAGAPA